MGKVGPDIQALECWTPLKGDAATRTMPALAGWKESAGSLRASLDRYHAWACAYATGLARDLGGGSINAGALQCVRMASQAYAWAEEFYRVAAVESRASQRATSDSSRTAKFAELAARMADAGRFHATEAARLAALFGASAPDSSAENALEPFLAELQAERAEYAKEAASTPVDDGGETAASTAVDGETGGGGPSADG